MNFEPTVLASGKRVGVGVLAALVLLLPSCSPERTTAPDPEVVARVDSRTLRRDEFELLLGAAHARGRMLTPEALLQEWVERSVLLARAEALRVGEEPEARRAIEGILIGELKRRELEPLLSSVAVSDSEVEQEYRRDATEFSQPEARRISILRRRFEGHISDAKRERIRNAMAEARGQALNLATDASSFGNLAMIASDDQATRIRGGEAGWVGSGESWRWEPPVIEAAFALTAPGEISPVIETTNAVYLVRLEQIRLERRLPLEEVAPRIRQRLTSARRLSQTSAFSASCREGRIIEVYPARLAQLPTTAGSLDATSPPLGATIFSARQPAVKSPPSFAE